MLSNFFKAKPVVDETTREWIFDTFVWCIAELDGEFFQQNSELILPSNTFYPGSASCVEEMAETIFTKTIQYSGMTSWPIKLVPSTNFTQKPMSQLFFETRLRGVNCKLVNKETISSIDIAFHPSQLNQPQDLIAYLVQTLAHVLVSQNGRLPSRNEAVLAQTIDLVACFMGFGVIFANTAYQFKGGCGSCNNRNLNRQAALPELETVYVLALFSVIKGGDMKKVKRELKSHLYKPFRQAHKEITQYLQNTANLEHVLLTANFSR